MMDNEEQQEQLYKIQLLQAFRLEEWDDDIINSSIVKLFDLMKLDVNLEKILLCVSQVEALEGMISMANECIDRKPDANVDADEEKKKILFTLLFQYEYFDLFHKCVYDFIHYWLIKDKTMNALLGKIQT
jgi:hypothetical protein